MVSESFKHKLARIHGESLAEKATEDAKYRRVKFKTEVAKNVANALEIVPTIAAECEYAAKNGNFSVSIYRYRSISEYGEKNGEHPEYIEAVKIIRDEINRLGLTPGVNSWDFYDFCNDITATW